MRKLTAPDIKIRERKKARPGTNKDMATSSAEVFPNTLPPTSRKTGLSSSEVLESRRKYGDNTLERSKKRSFIRGFVSNLGDPVIKVLLCALAVNLIFMFRGSDWIESAGIAVSVFLATLISTLSEYGSQSAFDKLSEECSAVSCRVRRDGRISEIPASELVYGDIVLIGMGERIPADGLLISGGIGIDQSALTGESREASKKPSRDTSLLPSAVSSMCSGCVAVSGEGEMIVTRVGKNTALGEISKEIQEETRNSPLKLRLSKLAKQISVLGYIAAAFVAVVYLVNAFIFDSGFSRDMIMLKLSDVHYIFSSLINALTLGLTVVVMAVPEGLPMMIAVVLSSNIKRMVKDNVLVRKPVGIEAAGSMNILFTDKTGTLTCGKMSVDRIITGDLEEYSGIRTIPDNLPLKRDYCACAVLNNSAQWTDTGAVGGNTTDRALLESVFSSGRRKAVKGSRKNEGSAPGNSIYGNCTVTKRIPFDSNIKYAAATVYDHGSGINTTYIKGAPERLLPYITECECGDGKTASFEIYRQEFQQKLASMTEGGARVLLIAVECDKSRSCDTIKASGFGKLRLICAVLLRDRLRSEAYMSVRALRNAGIQVVMITGDNKATAAEIASGCGILGSGTDICITGDELAAISDEKLSEILPRLAVVARALPADKSRLVKVAQEKGLVVGMTGDGINDAPALKKADIGFAMGGGTQVAKDAGDIIILDNNLSSIAKAVLYGRTIFKSIRKFITLQLTMNFCAVGVCMIGPFIGVDAPVTVVQMLWINIIMDTLGGLAFSGEPPLDIYMKEKPKRRDEPILNRYMVNEILLLGGFTVAMLISFLKFPGMLRHFRSADDNIYVLTAFFALFIFSGVFNCFNTRTDRLNLFSGISENPTFIMIMTAVCTIQILFVYLGGSVLRTIPLSFSELKYTMLLALSVFPAELIRKIIWKIRHRRQGY